MTRIFNSYADPGQGWLEAESRDPVELGIAEKISHYSYCHKGMSSIRDRLAALDCDYARIDELRDQELLAPDEADELAELTAVAGECETREDAMEGIREGPLSVQVRSGWCDPGDTFEAEEFEILLCTGDPAVRICGELTEGTPRRAYMQHQSDNKPWTDYCETGCGETLLRYAQCFYYGG